MFIVYENVLLFECLFLFVCCLGFFGCYFVVVVGLFVCFLFFWYF